MIPASPTPEQKHVKDLKKALDGLFITQNEFDFGEVWEAFKVVKADVDTFSDRRMLHWKEQRESAGKLQELQHDIEIMLSRNGSFAVPDHILQSIREKFEIQRIGEDNYFKLDPNLDLSQYKLTHFETMCALALQRYGAYIQDGAGPRRYASPQPDFFIDDLPYQGESLFPELESAQSDTTPEEYTVMLHGCARCGELYHPSLTFKKLTFPVERDENYLLTHWAPCPTNGEPIMMRFVDDNDGVPNT